MSTAVTEAALIAVRDPGSTRLVYGIVVALVVLGIGFAVLAWWLARVSRPDPELLAPLEAIQGRRWNRLDPAGRRRLLDELRPEGAEPVDPARSTPAVDEEFEDAPATRDVRELAESEPQPATADTPDEDTDRTGDSDGRTVAVPGEVGLSPRAEQRSGDAVDLWAEWDDQLGLGGDGPSR